MDQMRLLIALVLSFLIFMLWNVFFSQEPKQKPTPQLQQETQKEEKKEPAASAAPPVAPRPAEQVPAVAAKSERPARQITVDTPLYRARLSEKGAGITSFTLKNYRETAEADSMLKNLIPQITAFNGLLAGVDRYGLRRFEKRAI
jgi:YidC/Oxa1 family membrane protein insertase